MSARPTRLGCLTLVGACAAVAGVLVHFGNRYQPNPVAGNGRLAVIGLIALVMILILAAIGFIIQSLIRLTRQPTRDFSAEPSPPAEKREDSATKPAPDSPPT